MQSSRPSLTQRAFPTKSRLTHVSDVLCRLTNGYVVTVDFDALIKLQQSHKLPDRVSAMCTTKVRHRRSLRCGCRAGAVTVRPATDGGCASAVGVQVFNEYLQDICAIKTSDSGQRVACCGDCSVKVVHRTGMEFEAPRACGRKRCGLGRPGSRDG